MGLNNETTTCSKHFSFLPQTSLLIQQSTIQISGHAHPLMTEFQPKRVLSNSNPNG